MCVVARTIEMFREKTGSDFATLYRTRRTFARAITVLTNFRHGRNAFVHQLNVTDLLLDSAINLLALPPRADEPFQVKLTYEAGTLLKMMLQKAKQ